jgi:hypothetical protein
MARGVRTVKIQQVALMLLVAGGAGSAFAQFNSGSTGADGALNITSNTVLPVQADGVHNYTTINVNGGVTLSFSPNATNSPVVFLASGDVTISGAINLDGATGRGTGDPLSGSPGNEAQPGPGGFPGGIGGVPTTQGGTNLGKPGGGPGGGAASNDPSATGNGRGRGGNAGSHFTAGGISFGNANAAAPIYGDTRLISLSGGSGGAGGDMIQDLTGTWKGPAGGAGGGAILIASSGTITINGSIVARGGSGHVAGAGGGGGTEGSGGGSGGAIRLMADTINGGGSLAAHGGGGAATGGNGLIRLEAFSFSGNIVGNSNPVANTTQPGIVMLNPANVPTITITSIGGQAVPGTPTGSTATPDVTIPAATANPVTINMTTINIPNGAVIRLRIVLQNGSIIDATSNAVASNAATASVTLPQTVGVIYATADFTP